MVSRKLSQATLTGKTVGATQAADSDKGAINVESEDKVTESTKLIQKEGVETVCCVEKLFFHFFTSYLLSL